MFSKILPLTDETTEDQRVSADRRSLPPPPSESSDHRSGGQGFLGLRALLWRREANPPGLGGAEDG